MILRHQAAEMRFGAFLHFWTKRQSRLFFGTMWLCLVQRAFIAQSALLQHVSVDHSRLYITVPQKLLNGPNVIPIFRKMLAAWLYGPFRLYRIGQ